MFGRKESPKETSVSTEDDRLVEINKMYDSEKSFRRVGDKNAAMIQSHHITKAVVEYETTTGNVVTRDSKADRYTRWNGKWR